MSTEVKTPDVVEKEASESGEKAEPQRSETSRTVAGAFKDAGHQVVDTVSAGLHACAAGIQKGTEKVGSVFKKDDANAKEEASDGTEENKGTDEADKNKQDDATNGKEDEAK
jgi:hypothetical protein